MTLSLRTTSYTAALVVATILSVLLLLGSRQYSSYKGYENIIDQNEKIIFQFASIREHITESLLEGRHTQLTGITNEIEDLNSNISRILQEPLIPDEYRISFVGQIDIAGITLLLRSIGIGDTDQAKIRQLNQEIRILGERLMLFDRVIVNHVKRRLVGFQSVVIGILAIMIFVVIYILLFWYRQIAIPLFDLMKQVRQIALGKRAEIVPRHPSGEIAELAGSFQDILVTQNKNAENFARHNRILTTASKVETATWKSKSTDKIFTEACKTILTNEDYCLAWIGAPDNDGRLQPLVADASTSMSRRECDECMAVLLATAEEKGIEADAARKALQTGKPVILRDVLADIPKGPFKNTPLADGFANCAAFPLIYDRNTYGILTIYSVATGSFSDQEIELLARMTGELALSIYALESKWDLGHEKTINQHLVSAVNVMLVTVSAAGKIISFNQEAEKVTGIGREEALGREWLSLIQPEENEQHKNRISKLLSGETASEDGQEMRLIAKDGSQRIIRYHYSAIINKQGLHDSILWIGVDLTDPRWVSQSHSRLQNAGQRIFADSQDMILVLEHDGKILEANPQALAVINQNTDDIIGKNIFDILYKDEAPPAEFTKAVHQGSGQIELKNLFGEFLIHLSPLLNMPDKTGCSVMCARDISDSKNRKLETIRAAKLAATGELAMGVAHEINNQSNVLINYTEILLDEMGKINGTGPEHIELLNNIIKEGERIAKIVQQLLSFNSNRSELIESVQIKKVLEDSFSLIKDQLRHDGASISINIPEGLPPVRINVQKMQHVFLNILNNARHALNTRYSGQHQDKCLEIKGETLQEGEQQLLRICFKDHGAGINPSIMSKLFDPFFSTKPNGEGTGLGLSISQSLIRDNRGEIHVESVLNDHTTITIDLPIE